MITKYGYDVFFTLAGICVIIVVLSFAFIEPRLVRYGVASVAILLLGFTLNFFRDPDRKTPPGDGVVVSPADGKVILIKRVQEQEFIKGEATQISIFMSPLDVHVNRVPVTGSVAYYRYIPGEYFAAFEDKASEKNEQSHIGIQAQGGKILFKQIAGFVARRIVCTLKVGDHATAGERFGMIKFGSRMDVFLPPGVTPRVAVGDAAVAGETILAELP